MILNYETAIAAMIAFAEVDKAIRLAERDRMVVADRAIDDLHILRTRLRQDLADAEYLPPLAPPGGPQPEPGETYSAPGAVAHLATSQPPQNDTAEPVGGHMPEPAAAPCASAHAASDGGSDAGIDCSASVGGD